MLCLVGAHAVRAACEVALPYAELHAGAPGDLVVGVVVQRCRRARVDGHLDQHGDADGFLGLERAIGLLRLLHFRRGRRGRLGATPAAPNRIADGVQSLRWGNGGREYGLRFRRGREAALQ